MTNPENWPLISIAWRLERLRRVPNDVLAEIVLRDGLCVQAYTEGEPPHLTGNDTADRELAARLCAGCPVQDECLELELRMSGDQTTGVWGALAEDDRRALYPYWHRLRGHAENNDDPEGGQWP